MTMTTDPDDPAYDLDAELAHRVIIDPDHPGAGSIVLHDDDGAYLIRPAVFERDKRRVMEIALSMQTHDRTDIPGVEELQFYLADAPTDLEELMRQLDGDRLRELLDYARRLLSEQESAS